MATQTRPPLASFTEWVRATDPDASQRLSLLERARKNSDGALPG